MNEQSQLRHGVVSVVREINASRELVYSAWTELEHRRQWFAGPGWQEIRRELDLSVGGGELAHGRFPNGIETIYQSRFHHIEPNARLIYAFDMRVDGAPHSVSLAGVSFEDLQSYTRLSYTEQAFFLADGYGEEGRLEGTNFLIDGLNAYLSTLA